MKTRTGFVSNSSTCSFIILGFEIPFDREAVETIIERLGLSIRYEDFVDETLDDEDYDDESLSEFIWAVVDEIGNLDPKELSVQNRARGVNGAIVGYEPYTVEEYGYINGAEGGVPISEITERLDAIADKIGMKAEYKLYAGSYGC